MNLGDARLVISDERVILVDLLDALEIAFVAADRLREDEVVALGDEDAHASKRGELAEEAVLVVPRHLGDGCALEDERKAGLDAGTMDLGLET